MKIKLLTKTLIINNDGSVSSLPSSSLKQFNLNDIPENLIIKNYIDFMEIIRDINREKCIGSFVVSIQENTLFLLKKAAANKYKAMTVYKIENSEIETTLRQIFKIDNNSNAGRIVLVKEENRFLFVCNADILQVILGTANLRSQGKSPFLIWDKYFPAKKKTRKIYAPEEEIKKNLSNLDKLLQVYFGNVNESFQVAYRKNKNVLDAARLHKENKYVFCIDLKHFFESCKTELVRKKLHFLFKDAHNGSLLENMFLDIITDNGGLFLGNPISGSLANAIISKPVAYINNMCKKMGVNYSVYADDMVFSSERAFSKDSIIKLFNEAFKTYELDSYFHLNEDKTHGMVGDQRTVLGVRLNVNNQTACKKQMFRLIRVQIHKLSLDIEDSRTNIEQLRGRIAWCLNIDETGKVVRYLEKFLSTIQKFNLVSNDRLAELGIL